ncbi:MAG: hypothetical protein FJX42_04835 [Alphaproteobacteria bacterium]|nr:hypothetical protein [Alphaproteobacteria bacterium]
MSREPSNPNDPQSVSQLLTLNSVRRQSTQDVLRRLPTEASAHLVLQCSVKTANFWGWRPSTILRVSEGMLAALKWGSADIEKRQIERRERAAT